MRRLVVVLTLLFAGAFSAAAQTPNTITTIAGGGSQPGAPTSAFLPKPIAVARDAMGNAFVALPGLNTVYVVNSGTLSVFAGNGIAGFSGDGGPAGQAQLSTPTGVAVDSKNNVFIVDSFNNRIRRVDATTHVITTVAGSEDPFIGAYAGDGGPATKARLNSPTSVAVDANEDLFITDTGNFVVRRVDGATQIITTFAGSQTANAGCPNGPPSGAGFADLFGIAVDGNGNVFVSDDFLDIVCRIDPSNNLSVYVGQVGTPATPGATNGDGGPATSALLLTPSGLATDSAGDLFIADAGAPKIREVLASNQTIKSVVGIGFICGTGGISLTEPGCGDGGSPTSAALNFPRSVFVDASGLLIADTQNQRVRAVNATLTTISAFAGGGSGGDGGPATSATLAVAQTLAVDSKENVFALETHGVRIREFPGASAGNITTVAGDGFGGATQGPAPLNGDGGPATAARFVSPLNITQDAAGNFYIVDVAEEVVRAINNGTTPLTIGTATISPGNIAIIAGNGLRCGKAGNPNTRPGCGDNGPALSASLVSPQGVAVDPNTGDVYITDAVLNTVRVVSKSSGTITTFAGQAGKICTTYPTNCGDGGAPTSALLNTPIGITADFTKCTGVTSVTIADAGDNVVRQIVPATACDAPETMEAAAFNGLPTFGGDGGPALEASMSGPSEVALDERGNLYVGGGANNVVRRIEAGPGTVTTVAGDVHNLGGGFRATDEGGPSVGALLENFGLAIVPSTATPGTHSLYIADSGSNRIRKVSLAPATMPSPNPGTLPTFPTTLEGSTSDSQIIFLPNTGLDDLILTNVVISSNFTLQNSCTAAGGAPGLGCDLNVAFAPAVGIPPGTITGTLTLNTNDPAHLSITYNLTGIASNTSSTLNITEAGTGAVSSDPPGINCISGAGTCSAPFAQGATVKLTAIGTGADAFSTWSTPNFPGTPCNGSTTPSCSVTMPAGGGTVNANFATGTFTVTVNIIKAGGGSGSVAANGGPPCSTSPCTFTFPLGTPTVTLTPTPTAGNGSVFAGWIGLFCSNANVGPCQTQPVTQSVDAVFGGPFQPFGNGQIFFSTDDGMVFIYDNAGNLKNVLGSGTNGGRGAGMAFDSNGSLFMANNGAAGGAGAIEVFNKTSGALTNFGQGFNSPFSIAIDPFNNVFLGQLVNSQGNQLLEFAAEANTSPTTTFFPAYEGPTSSATWVDVLPDNETFIYSLGTQTLKVFDIGEFNQHPDLITNLHGAHALRVLPDSSILVADTDRIARVSTTGTTAGTVIQTYVPATGAIFFNLNLDPDGLTYWTNDIFTGNVFRVNITTGATVSEFSTPLVLSSITDSLGIGGIAVFGGQQSGAGADLSISMVAPANGQMGANTTWTLTVANNGPSAATGVTISDTLPTGYTVSGFPANCTGTDIVSCTVGSLNVGQTTSLQITGVPSGTGAFQNSATVSGDQLDPNTVNNTATGTTAVAATGIPVTVFVDSSNSANSVTSSPVGIDCMAGQFCSQFFAPGSITLTANGTGFASWTLIGIPGATCGTTPTCTFTPAAGQQALVQATYASPVGFLSIATLPEGVVTTPYSIDLSQAIIGGKAPYTFSITGGNASLPAGLALNGTFISGTPTTASTKSFTISVVDSSAPPSTAQVNASITIIPAPSSAAQLALLNGPYGILFRGVSDADASLRDFVASVPFDGKGGIKAGGSFDANGNGANGQLQTGLTFTGGTYSIGTDFRGLATASLSDGSTIDFAFSVGDVYATTGLAYTIHLIRFDDITGTGVRGAGLGKRQDPTAFTPASLAGTYVVSRTGQSTTLQRFTEDGVIGLNASGLFTALSEDFNNNGTTGTDTLISGSYGTDGANGLISTTGHTQFDITFADTPTGGTSTTKTATVAVVIVDADTLFSLKIDSGTANTLSAGIDRRQANFGASGFSPSLINGNYVLNLQGPSGANTSSNSAVLLGLLNTNGLTSFTVTFDENNDMAVQENVTQTGTLAASSNGRATFNFGSNALTAYFWDTSHAFVMSSSGTDPAFGTLELQRGSSFSTRAQGSAALDLFFGNNEPASSSGGPVNSGVLVLNGNQALLTEEQSHERGTLIYGATLPFVYSTEANGRTVAGATGPQGVQTTIAYNVSPTRFLFTTIDPTEHHPIISDTSTVTMPPGVPSPATAAANFTTPVPIGTTATLTLTFANTGDGLLSITGFTNAADFSVSGSCVGTLPTAPVVLPADGGSCTAVVTFGPGTSTQTGVQLNEAIKLTTDFGTITINASGQAAAAASCSGTNNWTGSAGDNQWNTPTNWSLNAVPGSADDACINNTFAGSTIKIGSLAAANQTINSLNSSASLDLQGGPLSLKAAIAAANAVTIEIGTTLTLNGPGTIGGALNLSGTLTGTGAITVTGPITWTGNALMTGTGSTTANGGITFNIPVGTDAGMGSRTLNNAKTATWPGAASEGLLLDSGAIVNNLTGATWNFQSDNGIAGDGTGIFNNAGTFEKTGGTTFTTIQVPFNNTGSVSVTASGTTLNLANGGSCGSTCGGSFSASTGATLEFGGGTFNLKGQIVGAGGIHFHAIAVNYDGSYNVSGGTTVDSGAANFTSGATVTSVGPLNVSGGTLNFSTGFVIPLTTVSLTGGTLTGTDILNSTGLFNWFGPSTISGTGQVSSTGGMSIQGNVILSGRALNLSGGTATLGNATAPAILVLQSSAAVNNNVTWNFVNGAGSNAAIGGDGTGTFFNTGTFEMTGGTSNLLQVNFTNLGAVTATTGTFNFQGSYTQRSPGTTSLNGGSLQAAAGQTISAPGTISGNIVTPGGTLAPGTGTTAGTLTVNGTSAGNYQAMTGNYNVKLGGTAAGQFDTTAFSGTATISGATLNVSLINGFTPAAGQSFQILTAGTLTGTFPKVNVPPLAGGLTMQASYSPTAVTLNVAAASGTFTLTVADGGIGTGTVTGNGIDCVSGSSANCTVNLASGTAVTLTAAATNNSTFQFWNASLSSQCTGSTNPVCSFTMPASNQNLTADFLPPSSLPKFGNTTLPGGAVGVPFGADIPVTGGTPPYTFMVVNSTLPTSFTLDTTANGNTAAGHVFSSNPPSAGSLTFSVIVTDNSGNSAGPATITIPIGAAPANTQALLVKGQWALLERSFSENSGDEEGAVASLKFDGINTVTGVADINGTGSSGIQTQVPLTGNYSVASDNTMFVSLTAPSSSCTSPPCTVTFVMAVGNVYRGQAYSATVTQFNDDNGNDNIGSGFMLRQDTTAFNNNALAGTQVAGLTGQTPSHGRVAEVAITTFDNALNVKSGSADINEAGTLGSITSITGTYTTPDANGHTVLSLTLTPGGAAQTSAYIVSANRLVTMSLDSRTTNDLLIGTALRQIAPAGGFGSGSIVGPDILTLEGVESDGGFDVIVGQATVASGTLSVTFDEESDGKTPTIGGTTSGPVTAGANGRFSSQLTAGAGSGSTLIVDLATPDRGFVISSGSVVLAGELKPQVGAPFSATPLTGNIFFGLEELLGSNSSISGVGALQSGTTTLNITDSESHNGGDLSFHQSVGALTLTVASSGSFTGQGTAGIGSTAGYLVSPFEFDLIDTIDSSGTPSFHPQLIVAQTLTAPPGTPSPASSSVTFSTPVTIGSSATSAPITITNTGLGPLGLSGTGLPPDFKFDPASTCIGAVVIVQPDGTCTLLIDFAPSAGAKTGTPLTETLTLTTDGTSNINVTATGTAAAAATPDFTISAVPPSQTVAAGGTTTYTINISALNGFTGSAVLSVNGFPSSATLTFNPTSITPGTPSTLTVATVGSTPPGTSTLTITGTSGTLSHKATVQLVVTGAPDFSVSATPPSGTVTAGSSTTFTVNAAALNGFTGTVALSASGLPTGATPAFAPGSITPGTPSTLTINTAATTPAGTSTVTITGTSGSLLHTATVQLVVNQVLTGITVTPPTATVVAGTTQQYLATGIFADKSTQNITNSVTWASSDTTIATISNTAGSQGLATGVKAGGPVTITATQGTIKNTASLGVTDFTVSATPGSQTINAGNSTTFTINIQTINAAALNFNGNVALTLSGQPSGVTPTFAPTSIAPGTPSTLTLAVSLTTPAGTFPLTITGTSSGVTRTATAQLVVNQVLQSIAVTPNPASVGVNNTLQFTATGTFGDKSTQNLTNQVQWASSDSTIASIDAATGLATGIKPGGPVTITATQVKDEISGTAQLTVTQIILALPPGTPLAPPPIPPGGTLVVPLVLSVPPGTKGTVTLGCTVSSQTVPNASQFANCVPVPNQVVLTGTGTSTNTALVVKFFCSDVPGAPSFRRVPGGLNGPLGMLFVALAMAGMGYALRRRPRWAMSFALLALMALGTASCSSPQAGPNGATPPGNYTITLTATLNGETASINIPVTIE